MGEGDWKNRTPFWDEPAAHGEKALVLPPEVCNRMRHAASEPEGVIRVTDEHRLRGIASVAKGQHGNDVMRPEVEGDYVSVLAEPTELESLSQRARGRCAQRIEATSGSLGSCLQKLRDFEDVPILARRDDRNRMLAAAVL
jgi:hypothetical protein